MVKLQGLRQHYTSLNHSLETFRKLGIVPANDNENQHKNIGHIAHTIVSWLNTKQSQMGITSDLMMIISTCILTIITREMGKLNTYSPGDTAPYIAWMMNESIDLILDTLSTEYTQNHLRTPLELGRGPEGSTMPPPPPSPTSLQNYVFLNPQSVHNKKWDVNSKVIIAKAKFFPRGNLEFAFLGFL